MAFNSPYVIPQEGLNYSINIFPKGVNTIPSGGYIGLFTTAWTTITGYSNYITLNGAVAGSSVVNEASFAGYARQFVPSGSWGTTTSGTATISGTAYVQYCTTISGYTFTANASGTVYGIFLASTSVTGVVTSGTGSGTNTPTVFWYAPFSDLNPVTLASGDSIVITPTWQFAANAG